MEFGGKFLKAAFVGGLILVLTSVLVTPASAVGVATGTYNGTGGPVRVTTNLVTIKVLRIAEIPIHGQGAVAYTTEGIQVVSPGTFLNGTRRDTGISFDVGNFIVSNSDFTQVGVVYAWEALGD